MKNTTKQKKQKVDLFSEYEFVQESQGLGGCVVRYKSTGELVYALGMSAQFSSEKAAREILTEAYYQGKWK